MTISAGTQSNKTFTYMPRFAVSNTGGSSGNPGSDIGVLNTTRHHLVKQNSIISLTSFITCLIKLPTGYDFKPRARSVLWLVVSDSACKNAIVFMIFRKCTYCKVNVRILRPT